MSITKIAGIVLLAVGLGSVPAGAAGVCTDKLWEAKRAAILAYLQNMPDKASKFDQAVRAVEEDYGGKKPPHAKRCEAMGKLLTIIRTM